MENTKGLIPGLYQIYWKSGHSSLAAIGMTASGKQWIAATNWLAPSELTSLILSDIERAVPVGPYVIA